MTDEHYRTLNRAIVQGLTEDDELREAARTALHHIFGREKRLREDLERFAMQIATDRELLDKKDDELARLRDRLRVYEGDDHNDGRDPYIRDLKAELARLREENENLRGAHGPGKCVRQARPEALLERDDALKETQ